MVQKRIESLRRRNPLAGTRSRRRALHDFFPFWSSRSHSRTPTRHLSFGSRPRFFQVDLWTCSLRPFQRFFDFPETASGDSKRRVKILRYSSFLSFLFSLHSSVAIFRNIEEISRAYIYIYIWYWRVMRSIQVDGKGSSEDVGVGMIEKDDGIGKAINLRYRDRRS